MQVTYDAGTVRQLMEDTEQAAQSCDRARDRGISQWSRCTEVYTRVSGKIQEQLARCRRRMESARAELSAASAAYSAAMSEISNADEDEDTSAASAAADRAAADMERAREELEAAEAEYAEAQAKFQQLMSIREQYENRGSSLCRTLEDEALTCSRLTAQSSQDLGTFMNQMEQARSALYDIGVTGGVTGGGSGAAAAGAMGTVAAASGKGNGPSGGASGGSAGAMGAVAAASGKGNGPSCGAGAAAGAMGAVASAAGAGGAFGATSGAGWPAGWCPQAQFSSIRVGDSGKKECAMTIGGKQMVVKCNKSGFAAAHRAAVAAGDGEMAERTGAMFELETLRRELELTEGFSSVPQLGGYHRDVKRQDPPGYESHHIPSRAVQDENGDWLPTISISAEDHKHTFSYKGKQRSISEPLFASTPPNGTYKQEMAAQVAKGSSGYVHAVRCELLDLRRDTGHKYDGGISAFLDAAIDMIATRGIPKSKD